MHTRSACRLGQTIEIDISVKSRWRCLAAARIQADLSYDNKMFQVSRNIPLALDVNKRSFGISIPWEPKMCGGAILSLSNVRCYDIFGLNCIKTELFGYSCTIKKRKMSGFYVFYYSILALSRGSPMSCFLTNSWIFLSLNTRIFRIRLFLRMLFH